MTIRMDPDSVREWWKEIILVVVGTIGAAALLIQLIVLPLIQRPWDPELAAFALGAALGIPLAGIEFVRKGEKK